MVDRILVKANNWLGDSIMSLPALHALRELAPKASISVLTKTEHADLYANSGCVDEVIPHERNGLGTWMETVRNLRSRRFDAALVLPRSFGAAFLVWSARIPRRIGYADGARRALLTEAPAPPPAGRHRVHYYHHLVSAFGEPPAVSPPRLELNPRALEWAEKILPGDSWIGMNPGATYGPAKRWFPERFIELGRRLSDHWRILVTGNAAEAGLGERVARGFKGVNLAGKTDIPRLVAVISRCSLFITNDTGPMHVADALGVPIVAIFGPTDWLVTSPFGVKHTLVRRRIECSPCLRRSCPLGHHECMRRMTVDEVERACRERLG